MVEIETLRSLLNRLNGSAPLDEHNLVRQCVYALTELGSLEQNKLLEASEFARSKDMPQVYVGIALALVERCLPEIQWDVRKFGSDGNRFEAWVQSYSVQFRMAVASTPALAILSALVAVLVAKEAGDA